MHSERTVQNIRYIRTYIMYNVLSLHLTPATYLWSAIRQTENVDENVVRVGMRWRMMQREDTGASGHAGNSTWVRVAGQPRPTERSN